MKDEHRRRRKLEAQISVQLPDVDASVTLGPIKQVQLAEGGNSVMGRVDVQPNDFIVTSNSQWGISLYSTHARDDVPLDDSNSSDSDDCLAPTTIRFPVSTNIPPEPDSLNHPKFIARDVIVCTEECGRVSTWCARANVCLDSVTVERARFGWAMCVVSDTEFVVGEMEGHVCFFTHKHGSQLKHVKRIWKAHHKCVTSLVRHENYLVSTSSDGTARVWDMPNMRNLHTFYHDGPVFYCIATASYLLTCSESARDEYEKRNELRLFRNDSRTFPLVKLFWAGENLYLPKFINSNLVMFWRKCLSDGNDHDFLFFFEIDTQSVLAQFKVHCRCVYDYAFLDHARMVVCGDQGSRGVIATLPRSLQRLVARESAKKSTTRANRRFCTIV